jgi:hypothetical protein
MTTTSGVLNNGIKKNKKRKGLIPKIVVYLSCSTGRTHFAATNTKNSGLPKSDKLWLAPLFLL